MTAPPGRPRTDAEVVCALLGEKIDYVTLEPTAAGDWWLVIDGTAVVDHDEADAFRRAVWPPQDGPVRYDTATSHRFERDGAWVPFAHCDLDKPHGHHVWMVQESLRKLPDWYWCRGRSVSDFRHDGTPLYDVAAAAAARARATGRAR